MLKRNMLSTAVKLAVVGVTALSTMPVVAADAEKGKQLEEVVVTGSRIARNEYTSDSPITTFNADDVALSGVVSIDEYLKDLPAFTGYQMGTSTNNGSDVGQKKLDMRGLGFNRTLVLINGRRMVGDSYTDGAVDINFIPEHMIERVEVLKDGASTIYGSDALAGVVNFILRDKFEGFELEVERGEGLEDGQAENNAFSMLAGVGGSLGNMVMTLGWSEQIEMYQDERDFAKGALYSVSNTGNPDDGFILEAGGSSNSRKVRHPTLGNRIVFDDGSERGFTGADLYDYASVNALVTPNERWQFGALGTLNISDTVEGYLEGLYTRRTSHQRLAPDASFAVTPTFDTPNNGSQWNDFVPANNPFNPYGVNVRVNRRFVESGGRIFDQSADTYRLSAGFKGTLFDEKLNWDLSYTIAEAEIVDETLNYGRFDNWAIAVDPVACAGNAECAAAGVLNPFSEFGGISPEQMSFLTTGSLKDIYKSEMDMVALNLSGDLMELSGGMAGWAFGYEHRKETGSYSPDEFKASGLTTGGASDPLSGGFSVDEVYGEVYLPFTETFSTSASVRYSDYDTSAGDSTTFKIGANWQVVDSVRLRATYSTGFRAPNISELNSGEQTDFPIVISLCEFGDYAIANGLISQTVYDNCQALGVDTTPGGEWGFAWQSLVTASAPVPGVDQELEPEESESINLGFVFTPESIPGLQMSVEYWAIEVDDLIEVPDMNDLYQACMNSVNLSSPACGTFVAAGSVGPHDAGFTGWAPLITDAQVLLQNSGKLTTSGFDFDILYQGELNTMGITGYTLSWSATKMEEYERESPLIGKADYVGTATGFAVFPEWRMQFGFGLEGENWSVNYKIRYIDETKDRLRAAVLSADAKAEDVTYHDIVGTYTWNNFTISLGVNNVTDEDPPYFHSAFNANTEPGTYDVVGRRIFTRLNLKF